MSLLILFLMLSLLFSAVVAKYQLDEKLLDSTKAKPHIVGMHSLEKLLNSFANQVYGLGQKKLQPGPGFKGIVAHRGLHENDLAQENSMRAFELAYENQIWGIEFDIQWTNDDIPVIYHDPHLGRLHNKPDHFISKMSFHKLREMAPDIPNLQELVEKLGGKIHFMIELKKPLKSSEQKLVLQKTLAQLQILNDYHFMALNPDVLDSIDWAPKESLIDIAWFDMGGMLKQTLSRKHGGLTGHFVLLKESFRIQLKEKNIPFGTGFIESRGTLYRELKRGCTWVFTNHPLRLKAFLN